MTVGILAGIRTEHLPNYESFELPLRQPIQFEFAIPIARVTGADG
jgi:hypothetical protein